MKNMNRNVVTLASIAVLGALFGVGMLFGQEHGAGHGATAVGKSSGGDMSQAIFCPAKSTGQLCTHGTSDVLKLSGTKRQSWTDAQNRYNKAVEAATKQLLEDAKATLSPEEYTQVENWFAKGLNPEINRLLAAKEVAAK